MPNTECLQPIALRKSWGGVGRCKRRAELGISLGGGCCGGGFGWSFPWEGKGRVEGGACALGGGIGRFGAGPGGGL